MDLLLNIFIIYCIIFCSWTCFRWTTSSFLDSMIKVSLFIISIMGIIIEMMRFQFLH